MKPKVAAKWEMIDILFIRKNFSAMTWNGLLDAINDMRPASMQVSRSALRHQARRMGLFKNNILIQWSKEDVEFLRENYTRIGNVEMAAILNGMRRTSRIIGGEKVYRTFTKKHIKKKLDLLGLHRTREQILAVKRRNLTTTDYKVMTSEDNMWTRGVRKALQEEETAVWNKKRYVKVNGRCTPYARWFYHNFIETVPKGYIVYHLDGDTLNDEPDNLACSPRANCHSLVRLRAALPLLAAREQKILQQLPAMNYSRQREEIRQMHADLNRVRRIQEKIQLKILKNSKNSG
jgi:hypothetical protein